MIPKRKNAWGHCIEQAVVIARLPNKSMTARAAPHDYEHLARGKVVPHGIYDLLRNQGYISIGTNAETAEFIVDNLLWWWDTYGIHQYADCKQIMILCDAGGANSCRHHCFKKRLLWLFAQISRDLLICHYPPYCSNGAARAVESY